MSKWMKEWGMQLRQEPSSAGGEGHEYEQVGGVEGGVAVANPINIKVEGNTFQLKENEAYTASNAFQLKENEAYT